MVVAKEVVSGLFLVVVVSGTVPVLEDVLSDLGNVDVAVKQTELR